ncbi:M61 family metallopeptidase [Ferruginibacter sp.]
MNCFPVCKNKLRVFVKIILLLVVCNTSLYAGNSKLSLSFVVSMPQPANHLYHVVFNCSGLQQKQTEFKMAQWTPGYYQLMHYANNVQQLHATDEKGNALKVEKKKENSWLVNTANISTVVITYDVKATLAFVAGNYLDEERGYISPAGLFVYPEGNIKSPVSVSIQPYEKWSTIATGLEPVKNKKGSFTASNYDVLFDSPILMGNLDSLPSFTVNNIPHYFEAFKPGEFDRAVFMNDLKKIITTASGIIGDIPYGHYTFLGIGPGGGGIEHLNSASVAFTGTQMNTPEGKLRMYNFLAHEYFHHYNVKRIRPIELGPFDYDNGSRTKMLWLSEGITVYYEYIIVKRAELINSSEMLKLFQQSIKEYETKPGRNFQTPADASYVTWDEGPFGRTGDEVNKTISPYDKGPLLGMLLDFKIRHETKNKNSLDGLMRLLYNKYYKKLGRGFTEKEFQQEAEKIAGTSLNDFFDYIYTLKTVDYPTYLNYAGLSIDTVSRELPGAWLGIAVRDRNDSLIVTNSTWQSPAWESGVRRGNTILEVNGTKLNAAAYTALVKNLKPGDKIKIRFVKSGETTEQEIVTTVKKEASYLIQPIAQPDKLQAAILKSWLGE